MYVFEDLWNYAAPHTVRLADAMDMAYEARMNEDFDFFGALEDQQEADADVCIDETILRLLAAETKNGGFPDTDLMKQALGDNALFRYKETSR